MSLIYIFFGLTLSLILLWLIVLLITSIVRVLGINKILNRKVNILVTLAFLIFSIGYSTKKFNVTFYSPDIVQIIFTILTFTFVGYFVTRLLNNVHKRLKIIEKSTIYMSSFIFAELYFFGLNLVGQFHLQ